MTNIAVPYMNARTIALHNLNKLAGYMGFPEKIIFLPLLALTSLNWAAKTGGPGPESGERRAKEVDGGVSVFRSLCWLLNFECFHILPCMA